MYLKEKFEILYLKEKYANKEKEQITDKTENPNFQKFTALVKINSFIHLTLTLNKARTFYVLPLKLWAFENTLDMELLSEH